jgi:hypothetical protein
MSLDQFIANVKSSGLARTNRYSVFFNPPLQKRDAQQVLLYCDQVQLPSLNFSTIQNRTFGEFREVPYEKLFGDISMSFYVDTNMKVKLLFDKWMSYIQDPTTRTFNYYDDYICDMVINVQDLNDSTQYEVKLFECYPKTMGAVQLDYASKDIMKLSITMQYKYFETSAKAQLPTEEIITTNDIQEFVDNFSGYDSSVYETGDPAYRLPFDDLNPKTF